jgi:hypothetical protein
MASFDIKTKNIDWDWEGIRISKNNPGNIVVDNSQLQVRTQVQASLSSSDESHYLGYVQIIRDANTQYIYYGNNVQERWEFSTLPISDSPSKPARPWYGLDKEEFIGGYRRQYLRKPPTDRSDFDLMNMSDNFKWKISKFENLANGSAGPNALTQIRRAQYFRVWLVAVEESKVGNLASYKRLMQFDWAYQFDCSVSLQGAQAVLEVRQDNPWYEVKIGDFMTQIPPEALNAPVGNENQQLNHYLNGEFQYVVIQRQG